MDLIYILGTDGAGKTTHAKRFVQEFNRSKIHYMYFQYFPFLLKPIKFIASKTLLRGTDEFKDYINYANKKKNISSKKYILTRLYSIIWYIDYSIQVLPRIYFYKLFKPYKIIIIDRYYLDSITHIGYLLNFDKIRTLNEARYLEYIFPKADIHFFFDVSPEVAFERKSDIQSIQYLIERKNIYKFLLDEYKIIIINADKSIEEVYLEFKEKMVKKFSL